MDPAQVIIPFDATNINPFESFDITESDMLPVIEPVTALKRISGRQVVGGGRRTRSSVGKEEVESMRVMYEDPGLADERKKLMELLKMQSQKAGKESPSKSQGRPSESLSRGTRTKKSVKSSQC